MAEHRIPNIEVEKLYLSVKSLAFFIDYLFDFAQDMFRIDDTYIPGAQVA